MKNTVKLNEEQLKGIIIESIKQVLNETRKYNTTLVMYSWYNGYLHENERTNDHMDHLIRRYNNIIRKYKKEGCLVFVIRFRGRRFGTIVDTNKRIISFVTILQNEDSKKPVLAREDISALSELLSLYNINPHIFGIRKIKQTEPSINNGDSTKLGKPLSSEEKRELKYGRIYTNWDMMDKTPKKWRKVRDEWEYVEDNT